MPRTLLILIFLISWIQNWSQSQLPDKFIDELLVEDFNKPVGIVFDHLGIGYIWEKAGQVWIYSNDKKSDLPIIDIREEVTAWGDHGLVGLALDPNFRTNGWIYLFYSVDRHHLYNFGTTTYDPGKTINAQATIARITRFTLDLASGSRQMIPSSRKVIVGAEPSDGLPILMGSHATGSLVFGEDGSLIYSFGDGASYTQVDTGNARDTYHEQAIEDGIITENDNVGFFRAMQFGTPNGKLSRVDPETGEGLSSNPFFDSNQPRSHQSRIWTMGLRNPYKFIKVDNTGSHSMSEGNPGVFIVGDVGSAQFEEVNIIKEGGKWFGWPVFEGHDYKWGGIWTTDMRNPEAKNETGCADFYRFKDLWQNEKVDGTYEFFNPCDGNLIPAEVPTFIHERPALTYNADKWNPPTRTLVPGFDNDGKPIGVSVLDISPENQVIDGGTSLPGAINYFDGFPSEYQGNLFLGDYRGFISTVTLNEEYKVESIKPFYKDIEGLTDFTFHPFSGDLYLINIHEGHLRRISYGGTLPPNIETEVSTYYGQSPLEVTFDSRKSRSYNNDPLKLEWNFGDGVIDTGKLVSHIFDDASIRSFTVSLTATDTDGKVSTEDYIISLNNTPPDVKITSVDDGSTYSTSAYNILPLEAEVHDSEHPLEDLQFAWRIDLYHDEHHHSGVVDPRQQTLANLEPVGCDIEEYWYRINLSVTDPAGLTSNDYVEVFPYCGDPIVSFLDFDATTQSEGVYLSWSLHADRQPVKYDIERTDEYLFTKIGEVTGENNAQEFMDHSPIIGTNKYRLKAYDSDGNYSYSEIRTVHYVGMDGFNLYPNPASQVIHLTAINPLEEPGEIEIADMAGKTLLEIDLNDEEIIQQDINITTLIPGVYFLYLRIGEKRNWRKFLVD